MAKKKVKSEEMVKDTEELEKSPTDALIQHVNEGGFDLKNLIGDYIGFAIIGYLFTLLFYSLLFPPLWSFILWIFTGFILYKSLEAYGNDKTWFSQILDDFGNYGFTSQSKDLETKIEENDVEIEPDETEVELEEHKTEEEDLTLTNYTEKFDEWRIAKDAVSGPFISAGDKISGFTFNSKSLYKLRLWMFLLLVPLLIWIIMWDIVSWPFMIWFSFWFSMDDAINLSRVCSLLLSYFIIIRIYSHCTNNRNLPINSDMLADYDSYIVKHLFRIPNNKDSVVITSKALLFDFIGGYLLIIFTGFYAVNSYGMITRLSLDGFFSEGYFSLVATILCIAVFIPILEELMFRGFVLDLAGEAYGKWTSIFISAIFFALVHPLYVLTVLNAFWAGLVYGYLRIRTNSLWPSIILHSLWNAHIVILQFFNQ